MFYTYMFVKPLSVFLCLKYFILKMLLELHLQEWTFLMCLRSMECGWSQRFQKQLCHMEGAREEETNPGWTGACRRDPLPGNPACLLAVAARLNLCPWSYSSVSNSCRNSEQGSRVPWGKALEHSRDSWEKRDYCGCSRFAVGATSRKGSWGTFFVVSSSICQGHELSLALRLRMIPPFSISH